MHRRNLLRTGALGVTSAMLAPIACAPTRPSAAASALPTPSTPSALPPSIQSIGSRVSAAPPPIGVAEQAERRAGAQRLMSEQGVDALFIESGPELFYFTGVQWGRSERTFGMLLPKRGDALLISPAFEEQRAAGVSGARFPIRAWQEDESPFALIAGALRDWGAAAGTIAVDQSARYFIPHGIAAAAPALRVVDASPVTQPLRGVKSAAELAIMRFANRITVEAYEAAFATMRPGMTQAELSATIAAAMTRMGFPGGAMALFGESSAYPHGLDTPRPLADGQVVLVDGGLKVHGYSSDISRTVVFGRASPEVARVYDVVRRAQSAALAAAVPGRTCGDVDAAARRVVEEGGFGPGDKFFTHRLGHGIGLEGHEWPYLVRGSTVVLRPGMTFSDEPGIYQYGKFGVRLEDIIAITDQGAEMLTEQAAPLA